MNHLWKNSFANFEEKYGLNNVQGLTITPDIFRPPSGNLAILYRFALVLQSPPVGSSLLLVFLATVGYYTVAYINNEHYYVTCRPTREKTGSVGTKSRPPMTETSFAPELKTRKICFSIFIQKCPLDQGLG